MTDLSDSWAKVVFFFNLVIEGQKMVLRGCWPLAIGCWLWLWPLALGVGYLVLGVGCWLDFS